MNLESNSQKGVQRYISGSLHPIKWAAMKKNKDNIECKEKIQ